MSELILIGATAWLIFGRALQQLNVQGGHYFSAALTPYLIAAGEVAVIGIVATDPGLTAMLACGTGGAIGATSAMWAHRRILRTYRKCGRK